MHMKMMFFYSYSIPAFYDKGYRYYLNVNYDLNSTISFWLKWSQTLYNDVESIGSGLMKFPVQKNLRSE